MKLTQNRLNKQYNTKMYITGTGWVDVECTNLADKSDRWLADVNKAMNFTVP